MSVVEFRASDRLSSDESTGIGFALDAYMKAKAAEFSQGAIDTAARQCVEAVRHCISEEPRSLDGILRGMVGVFIDMAADDRMHRPSD